MKVTVTRDDGSQVDVTEYVRIAYDCVRQSMDWGSGFLDIEEVNGIVLLSEACGFPDFEETLRDVWADREASRRNRGIGSAYGSYASAFRLRDEFNDQHRADIIERMRKGAE